MARRAFSPVLLAVAVVAGCGGDDQPAGTTASQPTTPASQPTTPAPRSCPDFTIRAGRVSGIQTTVGCDAVRSLAGEVLSRDDCVEETPDGVNDCTAQGYACQTRIQRQGSRPQFVVTCRRGGDEVRFRSATG